MAESKLENLPGSDDKFRCPICLEEVRNPKYLPCYHTFCKPCIQTYISSTAACSSDNSPKTIHCPVCRKSIQAPSDDASSEEWACSLPEDKLILSMSIDSDRNFLKKLDALQEEYKDVLANLNAKKQEILTCTETKIEEVKSLIDKAHNQWMKQFEQKHSDAVGHIEIASDEVKRLATTVQEANTMLQRVLENGSTKQIFVTRHKEKA
nr:E3 ubiquitin-protein ligase TRIM39-like [Crassostrea gigas]